MSAIDLSKNYCYKKHISRIKTKKSEACIKSQVIDITRDIKVYKNNFTIYKDCIIDYNSDFNGLLINVVFAANHFYKSKISDFLICPKANHTLINYISNDSGKIYYKKNSNIKNIIISIEPNFLKNFLKSSLNQVSFMKIEEKTKMLKDEKTHVNTKLCAHEIYTRECKNSSDILFIQSKVLEIISHELKALLGEKNESKTRIKFSPYDLEALNRAKKILNEDFQNSPSISELSKMVRLNEFKLKYGFKIFFKTSPYNMLVKNRMLKAKYLIKNSDLNISEIANKLGYKQAHNLASTFKKHFGITPKDYMKKNRKNYY